MTAKVRGLFRAPLGSALLGGLVVGILGWVAIAAGWIQSGDDEEGATTLAPAPLTRPSEGGDSDGKGLTVNQIYARDASGVAFVEAQKRARQPSPLFPFPQGGATATGSGFLIDGDGHVLTNAHVVAGAERIEVTLGEDEPPVEAELVGADRSTDMALLEVGLGDVDLRPLELGDSDEARVGDPVVAIGNPFGLDRTVTSGIVSALQRQIEAPNGFTITDVIQTDASINPGNSGGPLIDAHGRVIGITSQIATAGGGGSVGVGFAVPINTARDVAEQLLETGEVEHAFLGVNGTDVTPEIAEALNLPVEQGALMQRVVRDSPAGEAGIRGGKSRVTVGGQTLLAGGDVVTAVDGREVTGMDEVIVAIQSKDPGDELTLEIARGDERTEVAVILVARPEDAR